MITFDEVGWLDGEQVAFGEVIDGHDVVDFIEKQATATGNKTITHIRIPVLINDSGEYLEEGLSGYSKTDL